LLKSALIFYFLPLCYFAPTCMRLDEGIFGVIVWSCL